MSFSSDVRQELCLLSGRGHARHCLLSELAALINTAGRVSAEGIILHTENTLVAQRYAQMLHEVFQIEANAEPHEQHKHSYTVSICEPAQAARVLKATGCMTEQGVIKKTVSPLVVMDQCCKRAYIRGCFIAGGTFSDPMKTYHVEFTMPSGTEPELEHRFITLLKSFALKPKIMRRKLQTLVYLKEAENIVDLLNIMEAHCSLLQFENVRILKEMRNDVNRKVNFETANLNKTVHAAVQQIEDIRFIAERAGLGCLPEPLESVARLRLAYEEASLKEIGAMLSPPVGKSGVNHRLRKISEIAENLRKT